MTKLIFILIILVLAVNGNAYSQTPDKLNKVLEAIPAEYFINCGADVDRKNGYDNAAMVFAAKNGDLRMIRLLAAHGADVNIQGNGYTPLTMARSQGHQQAVELLKLLGAAEDSVDEVN